MIHIASNIKGLIAQLERFRALAPDALVKSIDPKKWGPIARNHARLTLEALARNDGERALIPRYLETVIAVLTGPAILSVYMTAPSVGALDGRDLVERVVLAEEQLQKPGPKTQVALGEDDAQLAALLDQAILDWILEEKDLSEEEQQWMDQDPVAGRRRISRNLQTYLFDRSITPEQKAPLMDALQDYIARVWWPGYLGEDMPDIGHWLVAVLNAWREMFLSQWPPLIARLLRAAWKKIPTRPPLKSQI